jgi:hypothetical protein
VRAVLPSALMRAFRASAGSGCAFAEDIGTPDSSPGCACGTLRGFRVKSPV